jgi:flagellar hook assembly protein FlgD
VPNPFNPSTTIRFDLARTGYASLEVYDLSGRHVRTLDSGYLSAGQHWALWNGQDEHGKTVASGVYFLRLSGQDFVKTQRVALIK